MVLTTKWKQILLSSDFFERPISSRNRMTQNSFNELQRVTDNSLVNDPEF